MKILQLIGNSAYGGATNIVIDVSDALRDKFNVVIMANDKDTTLAFKKKEYQVYKIDSMCREINPIKDIVSIFKLKKFIEEHNIDVIHSHTSKGGAYSRLVKLITKVTVVHTVHGFPFEYDNRLSNRLYRSIEKILAKLSDYITFVNESDYKYAKKSYKIKNLELILNGINETMFFNNDSISDSITIGIIARVVKQKGFDEFLNLVDKLQDNKKLEFEVLGDGPEFNYYKNYAIQNNLRISFLGFRKDVSKIISNWDIFVLPSWREGLPISVMEAMSSSLPCVVTNIRGNNELINDGVNGFLVEVRNYEMLIEKVRILVENENLRKNMGAEGRRIINQKYTKREMIIKYKLLFNTIYNDL